MPNKNKRGRRKKAVAKKMAPKRKLAKKSAAPKKSSLARKKTSPKKKGVPSDNQGVEMVALRPESREHRGGQSGDLQGLSNRAGANSESVEELLEEGNALEAEAVQGVENALDADQGEVETHEVPEDDVPEEYRHRPTFPSQMSA